MLQDDYCTILCQVDLKSKDVADFKQAIKRQYHHNWIVDNLPGEAGTYTLINSGNTELVLLRSKQNVKTSF